MRSFSCALAILLLTVGPTTNAQALRIQILYGKTGKPISNNRVVLMGESDSKGSSELGTFFTDADGVLTASQIDPQNRSVIVYTEWHQPCSKNRNFSIANIVSKGVVSENSCKKLDRTAPPGTLILFVRDETFFEKMAH
jgi:hypothetical protein